MAKRLPIPATAEPAAEHLFDNFPMFASTAFLF